MRVSTVGPRILWRVTCRCCALSVRLPLMIVLHQSCNVTAVHECSYGFTYRLSNEPTVTCSGSMEIPFEAGVVTETWHMEYRVLARPRLSISANQGKEMIHIIDRAARDLVLSLLFGLYVCVWYRDIHFFCFRIFGASPRLR
jgi:hypothetical protein